MLEYPPRINLYAAFSVLILAEALAAETEEKAKVIFYKNTKFLVTT